MSFNFLTLQQHGHSASLVSVIVLQSAPPSPAKGRSKSRSAFPSPGPEEDTPQSLSDPEDKPHRIKSSVASPDAVDPLDEQDGRWRPNEEGHSHSHKSSKDSRARDGRSAEHSRQNGNSRDRRHERRERSRERSRDAARRDPSTPERHKTRSSRAGQVSSNDDDSICPTGCQKLGVSCQRERLMLFLPVSGCMASRVQSLTRTCQVLACLTHLFADLPDEMICVSGCTRGCLSHAA